MTTAIRVLYVDDEPSLLDIGKMFLERSGEFIVTTATSATEGIRLLEQEKFDAIISDYQMPGMDGIQFLVEVRTRFGPIPFILFTGRGREEVVIQAINNGVDFYLQKGGEPGSQFAELSHKVKSAALRKKAEIALRENERVHATMISNLPGFVYRCANDSNWSMEFISDGCREITGYAPDELLNNKTRTYNDLVHPDFQKRLWDNVQNSLEKREVFEEEYPIITKTRETRWVWERGRGIYSDDGRLLYLEGFITDITERKRADGDIRTAEETYRNIFLNSQIGLFRTDVHTGLLLDVNDTVARFIGYPDRASLLAKPFNIVERYADAYDHEKIISLLKADGEFRNYEARFVKNDGSIIWMRFSGRLVKEKGWIEGVSEDITERKRAEMALGESELFNRNLVENLPDYIGVSTTDGKILYMNPPAAYALGYTVSEIIGTSVLSYVAEECRGDVISKMAARLKGGEVPSYEIDIISKDGGRISVIVNVTPIRYCDSPALLLVLTDITERKRAEKALAENEQRFNLALEGTGAGLWDWNMVNDRVVYSMQWKRMLGYEDHEVENSFSGWNNLWHPDDCTKIEETLADYLAGKTSRYEIIHRLRHKNGDWQWIMTRGEIIKDAEGKPVRWVGTNTDITEQKRVELALERQTVTLAILNEVISTANKADNLPQLFESILEESLRLLDFDAGGIYLVDRLTRTANVVHSKNLPKEFLAEIQTAPIDKKPFDTLFIKNEPIFTENYAQIAPDRSKKYGFQSMANIPLLSKGVAIGALNLASTRKYVISDEEKQTLLSIGRELGSTIERMAAEEKAKNASKNLNALFNSIDEMVFVLDMQGRILVVNNTVLKRLSYTPEELTGTDVLLLHVPELRDEALRNVQGMIAGTIDSCPVPVLAKGGTRIEVETKVTRGFWNGNEVLIGVSRDITERKRAEDALLQASRKLAMLNSITRHDILNQLMGLRTYLELSRMDVSDPVILNYIQKEEQAAEAIQWQIEFTKNYQDIGGQAPKWQNLSDTIGSAVSQLKPPGVEINVAVERAEVFADPLLEKVFYNLMENSLRHGEHVTRMDFSVKVSESGLILTYADNGVGVTADDKKKLFQKGFGKHTGLGLFLSKEILSITGITIREIGEPGNGARFEMTVPKGAWK